MSKFIVFFAARYDDRAARPVGQLEAKAAIRLLYREGWLLTPSCLALWKVSGQ
jgi:hypothetical protein